MTPFLIKKIKHYGWKESFKKSIPFLRRKIGEFIFLVKVCYWTAYNFLNRSSKNKNILYAFFDLRICPSTFDILSYLGCTSSECQERQLDGFHLVFVPGDKDGFKLNHPFEKDENRWRLLNIMIPCAWLFPLCKGVTVAITRQEAQIIRNTQAVHVFPKNYQVQLLSGEYQHDRPFERCKLGHIHDRHEAGYPIHFIEAQPKALYYARKWSESHVGEKKLVTMSLRGALYSKGTNSNVEAWIKFAKNLDQEIYHPVFVLDQETSVEPISEEMKPFDVFFQASFDNNLRAALYQVSYINLMVNNGPTYMAIWNKNARFLVFKMCTESDGLKAWRNQVLRPLQKFVWKEDSYEIISEEFEKMCILIEEYEKTKKVS